MYKHQSLRCMTQWKSHPLESFFFLIIISHILGSWPLILCEPVCVSMHVCVPICTIFPRLDVTNLLKLPVRGDLREFCVDFSNLPYLTVYFTDTNLSRVFRLSYVFVLFPVAPLGLCIQFFIMF